MGRTVLTTSAADYFPARKTLPALRAAAAVCCGCDLYKRATQTVFGEGDRGALMMLVGEQPGDEEDRTGKPFTGPAGRMLDAVLAEVEIDRSQVYVTNAVKHFKWTGGEKRRMHDKPRTLEILACRPWLEAEIDIVKPRVLVALGATAAQSLLGNKFRITRERGCMFESAWSHLTMATWHPSAVLRAPDHDARTRMRAELAEDLRSAARAAKTPD
jgi:DNA polymerase